MTSVMGRRICGGWPLLMATMLLFALLPAYARGQAAVGQFKPGQPIPRQAYQSWSLFLVCNHEWLLQENERKLSSLHAQFLAFGEAIGPKHLAVWFWKRKLPRGPQDVSEALVDADRSSRYCDKFGLLPSKSPHVLVTMGYPDLEAPVEGNKVYLAFKGHNSTAITALLTKLTDQLLVQGLRQEDLDSEAYWRAWQQSIETVIETAQGVLASAAKHIEVTIDTQIVKVRLGGGAE